ncbi:AMP-binding protein [Burkholderia sp. LMG 32019]|uniref:AMP-binding protein n=1 Tax=Burkholderia sp. LMG 32019 TaxID=3158173 RepID=UPI003C2ABF23
MSVVDLLWRAAHRYPSSGLRFVASVPGEEDLFVTYAALLNEARNIASALRLLGRRPGDKVVLVLDDARDFIPAFWACLLGGQIPCPLAPIRNDPARWERTIEHVCTLLDDPLLITTEALEGYLPDDSLVVTLDTLRHTLQGFNHAPAHEAFPDDPAVFVLTSGSTGNSKAVVLTHGNLLASMAGKNERQRLSASDVTLNWISFEHVAALLEAHLLPLYVGAQQVHVDSGTIIANPLVFLDLVSCYRVSMTFAPNFLFGQINAALRSASPGALQSSSVDLSSLRHIVSGGEATVVDTGRRFLELLAPFGLSPHALWPAFGMSETCAGSIYSREFPAADTSREFADLGTPIAGLQMRIADDEGVPVPDGEPGELQLRGAMVFSEYYRNEEATRAAFTLDGWFRTGDLGRVENGKLHLVGRSKDSIIVSGANYFSHELETTVEQLDGIERSFVAAFPTRPKGVDTEQLVVAFATSIPADDEARLHQLCIAVRNTTILQWGFRPTLILPLPKHAFPKTSLGKIQRATLRKRLEAGEFATEIARTAEATSRQTGGYVAPEGATETALVEIFANLFSLERTSVSTTASFFDLGGTSLDILKLQQAIDRRFDGTLKISLSMILQNPSARRLAARLDPARATNAAYDPIVPLQTTGTKTPLFCIHPGVGEVLVFVNLANYFVNDRPFYALRARGFNPGEPYFGSFDELVKTYVDAIRARQPHGPYAIAGYSYGGAVTLPVARLLESQGERVAFVGSIDAPPLIRHPRGKVDAVESAVMLAFFLSLIDTEQMETLPAQLRAIEDRQDIHEYLYGIAPRDRLAELGLDLPGFTAWSKLALALSDMGHAYVPSGTIESATVFYADPLWGAKQDYLDRELRRWDEFTRAPNRYIEVTGEHHTILDPRHVTAFQATLRAEIDLALNGL